jgi:dihydrofolate reductase
MRELIIAEFITLDGVIQAPGGADEDTEGGFTHGGWTWPYWHDDIGAHFFQTMSQADALLLGRKTWQIHGNAFEPMAGDPFGDAMNNIRKYVVSTTLKSASACVTLPSYATILLNPFASSSSSPARTSLSTGVVC